MRSLGNKTKRFTSDRVYTIGIIGDETEKLSFAASFLHRELEKRFTLHFLIQEGEFSHQECDIVVISSGRLRSFQLPEGVDLDLFTRGNAEEQGYILLADEDRPIYILSMNDQGCQYGVATLLQLFVPQESDFYVPHLLIEDYPEHEYRGNRWLIKVEAGSWAYDWGDGLGAYKARIRRKLDMAMEYKVNFIIFDGFGFGTDVYPEYAATMRELNRAARIRGIKLMHSGYGTGMAGVYRDKPDFYRGAVLENRREYPDGEIYHCIAGEGYCGTCLSNESLMEMRLEGIRKFVREVEPGALYIHQQDEGLTPETWIKRCPECRKKWPNDEVTAEDGMAGAYAYLYNRFAEAINSVRVDGYRAEEDCFILFVSPGYLSYGMDDGKWDIGLEYWATLSSMLTIRKNVYPGFREIFINHDRDSRRVPELRSALNKRGNGQGLGVIYFYGADSHHNDKLFLATPVFNYLFEGLDALLTACGNSYSEPLQLLNAEYMWNPGGSDFFEVEEKPKNFTELKKLYFGSQYNEYRPEPIFGRFLETSCEKLYGEVGGHAMCEMFLTEGANHEPPIPYLDNSGLIRGEMRGAEAEGGKREGSVFVEYSWPCQSSLESRSHIAVRIRESLSATMRAKAILDAAINNPRLIGESRKYLEWYASSLDEGARYVGYLERYISLVDGHESDLSSAAENRMAELLSDVCARRAHIEKSRLQPVDHLGGTQSGRTDIIDFVETNLNKIQREIEERRMAST